MPLPLAPIAGIAIRYGSVALAAYVLRRALETHLHTGHTDQRAEARSMPPTRALPFTAPPTAARPMPPPAIAG